MNSYYLSYLEVIEILRQLSKAEDDAAVKVKQMLLTELITKLEKEFK
jgi:hypothetical protein